MQNASGKKRVIDYILVRNDQWIGHIERKVQPFYARVGAKPSNLSDHYAMEADINFNTVVSDNSPLLSVRK